MTLGSRIASRATNVVRQNYQQRFTWTHWSAGGGRLQPRGQLRRWTGEVNL